MLLLLLKVRLLVAADFEVSLNLKFEEATCPCAQISLFNGNMEDIEDLALGEIAKKKETPRDQIKVCKKPIKQKVNGLNGNGIEEDHVESFVPGAPNTKIWVRTWGCSHNSSDSEYMSGLLSEYGFRLVQNAAEADLWLLNSCTVKNPAEDHFR